MGLVDPRDFQLSVDFILCTQILSDKISLTFKFSHTWLLTALTGTMLPDNRIPFGGPDWQVTSQAEDYHRVIWHLVSKAFFQVYQPFNRLHIPIFKNTKQGLLRAYARRLLPD
jgi:hypothetical protein